MRADHRSASFFLVLVTHSEKTVINCFLLRRPYRLAPMARGGFGHKFKSGITKFAITMVATVFLDLTKAIIIGVALETTRELEAQITMRNYKGFLD